MAWTISAIREANADAGLYFFSRKTMRMWRSRVLPGAYDGPNGVYFVTFEAPGHVPPGFTVRRFHPDTADVTTVDDLRGHSTARAARERARWLSGKVRTWRGRPVVDHDAVLAALNEPGATKSSVARRFAISRQRVGQIAREAGHE